MWLCKQLCNTNGLINTGVVVDGDNVVAVVDGIGWISDGESYLQV